MRITQPSPELPAIERGRTLRVYINQTAVEAYAGETVATLLLANGVRRFRLSTRRGEARGLFCGMGICYECLVTINGVPNQRACVTPIADGMKIEVPD